MICDDKIKINSYSGDASSQYWTDVTNGSTINIWSLKGVGSPSQDKFEPYAPKNFSITTVNSKPFLSWQHRTPVDDYWTGYEVYRCVESNYPPSYNYTKITTIGKTVTSYYDSNLSLGAYEVVYYKVKTKNTSEVSEFTSQIRFGDPAAPATPQNLSVSTRGTNPLLSWTRAVNQNIKEYVLYIRENGGSWFERARLSGSASSYTDFETNLTNPVDFLEYHLKAMNIDNEYSGMSNIVSVIGITEKINANNLKQHLDIFTEGSQKITDYKISNFPNPFNPTTKISYQLPESGNVSLKVYNSLGKEVAELVNGMKTQGRYTATFDASNLSSGIYFYTIQVNDFVQTNKMLLVK
ncbi:MAG: T9SS type A sorting domain-containing protein [Labilibaculum sp.]|nr:T9SS type A sorting domain-containing protein [Labilibaculum sp.]MBI9060276.1 T9SS type A sorting domain-containing protein [Labilibaculum sp.]